jgi:uncharacterized protein (TIGR01777 family)
LCGYCIHQEEIKISFINSGSPQPRFLLSGASGLLGSALRSAMAARNYSVISLLRRPPASPDELQWNPEAKPAIAQTQALENLTAAFHFSGANVGARRWSAAYKREIFRSRVDSTHSLAVTLAGLRHPPRMLLVASAVGIYGDRGDEMLDETSAPGRGFLADVCREWEEAARPAARAGIRVLHLRLGVVLSRDGGALGRLLPLFRMGLGARLGNGEQYMSWIAMPDVLAAMFFLLETPDASGAYNITAPNPVTNAQFTRMLAGQVHRPAFMSVPAFALRLAMGQMADEALLASARAYPARLIAAGYQFAYPSLIHALPAVLAPARR